MTDTPKTTKKMTQAERAELRRLVKQRFALLREQTEMIEAEFDALEDTLTQQLKSAAAASQTTSPELAQARQRADSLSARAQKLQEEYSHLEEREIQLRADVVEFRDSLPDTLECDLSRWRIDLDDIVDMTVSDSESSEDVFRQQAIEKIEQMKSAANVSTAQLREQENDLLLDITLGAIQSDEGLALMRRLPTVQQIHATAVPQIEAPAE